MHESGFVRARARMTVAVPPVWTMEPRESLLEQLDALVMRYLPPLRGVLVAHENQRYAKALGLIDADAAFAEAPAVFTAIVWRPQLGMRLQGTVTLSSPSHVSLLLHGTFNAAISASHLSSEWEFCHYEDEERDVSERSVGYWRHRRSHERLGGEAQTLEFTVISMTVANHMLSLHGSLLADPFSVPPPRPGSLEFELAVPESEEAEEAEVEAEIDGDTPHAPRRVRWDDSDSEEDAQAEAGLEDQVPQVSEAQEEEADEDDADADADADAEADAAAEAETEAHVPEDAMQVDEHKSKKRKKDADADEHSGDKVKKDKKDKEKKKDKKEKKDKEKKKDKKDKKEKKKELSGSKRKESTV
ncbi:hypothetical protein MCUN1_001268 [Malassezia cuniculi]|uniref:RPA43 OB domain-containing protein n=1 Tax=Malassezia cuniculi TaxID=948313 RepID=A0AAF0ETT5_9BASI|nr:hypothetical protein MCUN1_001268 [Malassezia cuniculi]